MIDDNPPSGEAAAWFTSRPATEWDPQLGLIDTDRMRKLGRRTMRLFKELQGFPFLPPLP